MPVEEVAEKLNTDIYRGLSMSDAADIKKIRNDGSAFTFPKLSPSDAAKTVLNDVLLYFFFFLVAILSAIFDMWASAIVAVVIILVNCFITVSLKIVSNRYENAVVAPTIPRVTVIRDGRRMSIDGRNAVPGDIILVKEGDILPCDVRVIRTEGLTVYESVPDKNGSRTNVRTRKCEGTFPKNAKLSLDKITNMIFAGGMVISGSAVCIAVACGKNTYVAKRFSGIEMISQNKLGKTEETIGSFFKYATMILFILAIPFSLILLFFGNAAVSPLDSISQTTAIAVSLPLQTITVLYSTVICCAVRVCASSSDKFGRDRAILKNYSTVGKLDSVKKIFMIGKNTVAGNGNCVGSVFVNLRRIVSPDDIDVKEDKKEPKELLECAYLIDKAAFASKNEKNIDNEKIILRSMAEFSLDTERIVRASGFLSYKKLAGEDNADVAIVSEGSDLAGRSLLICRAFDNSLIEAAEWYSSSGVDVKLDEITRERIRNEYYAQKELGYQVISIAKSIASLYDSSSFAEYEDQLVLVGLLSVGPAYSRTCAKSVKELAEQGITPVLFLDDDSEGIYIARNVFRDVKKNADVVRASDLADSGYSITDYPDADAYLGFNEKEITELISATTAKGVTCAAVATDYATLRPASHANYVVAYSNDTLAENACTEPYKTRLEDSGASCSMSKKYADMLVLPVNVRGGGLDGVLHAVSCVRSFFVNLGRAVSYLIISLIMRTIAVYLPLAFGRPSMNAAMIMYLGCFVDLIAVFYMSCSGFSADKKKCGSPLDSFKNILRSNLAGIVFAVLNGIVIAAAGLLIPKTEIDLFSDYIFIATFLSQLSMLVYTSLKGCDKIRQKDIWRAVALAAIILVLTVIFGIIPGASSVFGIVTSASAWLRAAVVFVICTLLGFVFLKDSFFA